MKKVVFNAAVSQRNPIGAYFKNMSGNISCVYCRKELDKSPVEIISCESISETSLQSAINNALNPSHTAWYPIYSGDKIEITF